MALWTEGYVSGVEYTYGYYPELNPNRAKLAFLNAGIKFPSIENACELGFGQGVSINFHATATSVNWYGNDFNPTQVAFAGDLSAAAQNKIFISDDSFMQYCCRTDLPKFDFIGLHGIWSWVSKDNQLQLAEFIRTKLKVGGIVYISYNTSPGWSSFVPVRHLMNLHSSLLGSKAEGVVSRINNSLKFIQEIFDANPHFSKSNPNVVDRFEGIRKQNIQYLAHEYFNKDWKPDPFSSVASILEGAKLEYVCSANYLEHVDEINFTQDQRNLLSSIKEPMLRESIRDFILNQQFRKDYWVKGKQCLGKLDRLEAMRNIRVFLCRPRSDVSLVLNSYVGEITLYANVYNPILDFLSNHHPNSIGEIESALTKHGIVFDQIIEAILVLVGINALDFAQNDTVVAKARSSCMALNNYIMKRAVSDGELPYLVSPVSGGGVHVDRFSQLFLLARSEGWQNVDEWTKFVLDLVKLKGERIFKHGVELTSDEEMLNELKNHAMVFEGKQLSVLKSMEIA